MDEPESSTLSASPIYTRENYHPENAVGRLIADLSGRMLAAFDTETADLGITGAQAVILLRIGNGLGSTAAELCRCGRYDTGSMTRMLDRLEQKGLIARVRNCEDRRVVNLELTAVGQELLPRLPDVAIKVMNHHLRGFSREEVEQLKRFLRRMLANAD